MRALRAAYHVAKANLLVRLRDRRLLAVVAGCVYLGHLVVAGEIELVLADQNYRGVENAAWTGTLMSMTASCAILLLGFYFVRGALARDQQARLGPLIASSPAGSLTYLVGTWAGSLLLLLCLVGVMAAAAAILFVLEGHGVPPPGPLLAPFLLFSAPMAAAVAALALAFECVPGLGGRAGGALYFVLAIGALILPAATSVSMDPLGFTALHESMTEALRAQHPAAPTGAMFGFGYFEDTGTMTTFRWDGVTVTAALLGQRLGLVLASLGLVAGAGLRFRRFDPSPEGWAGVLPQLQSAVATKPGASTDTDGPPAADADDAPAGTPGAREEIGSSVDDGRPARPTLGSLPDERRLRPLRMVGGELRLALKPRSWTWRLGALALIIAGFVLPSSGGVLALAWIWPMTLWASLGTRATTHRTGPLIATSLYPRAQRVAAWAAGALVALGMSLGPLLVSGNLGVLVGVAFVPALALAAGRGSGTPRLFEITFLLLWYLGPANQQAALDFGGVAPAPPTTQAAYLLAAALLLGGSLFGDDLPLT